MTRKNKFIDDVDLSESTSLTHLLDRHSRDNDIDETNVIQHSPYYSETQFINFLSQKAGLCILDLNIQNIFSKFDELESFVDRVNATNPIAVICLNECWLNINDSPSGLNLQNYNMFYKPGNRVGHGHCGLVIYIHNQFNATDITDTVTVEHTAWDYMCLEISHQKPNSKKYLISNIYRLPNEIVQDVNIFTNEFSTYLSLIKNRKRSSFICGDFNINLLLLDAKQHYNNFYDCVTEKSFFPQITLPTRIQNESYTLIDNIFTNDIEKSIKSKSGILINDISDHKIIFTFQENLSYIEKTEKYIYTEKYDEISMQQFIIELNNLNIYEHLNQNIDSSPQANYEIFSKFVKRAKDMYLPKRKVKYNKKRHMKSSWMTRGILNSINTKNMLYKIFIQADSQNIDTYNNFKLEYINYKATLRKSIRAAKRMYYLRLFTLHKNDIQKTWCLINSTITNKSKGKLHCEFDLDGKVITNSDEIADAFNEYFVNIGRKLSCQIIPVHKHSHYLDNETKKRMKLEVVNEDNINEAINRLKNKSSYGHDEISNKIIKRAKNSLIQPLMLIINQMLMTGKFPSDLKISRVKPLFKSGDASLFSNYRPISLLPSFSKIFEYIIFKQLYTYMNDNKLFSIEQYGFRTGHSTELAALHLVNDLTKQMDTGKVPTNIYIDLSKAFDTLDHSILLDKLNYYGIRGVAYNLLHSYISNRYQYVDFNGSISSTKVVDTGVPQGSILGPLLFLIYINDLPSVSPLFNMVMYADDTTLYCNLSNNTNENDLNSELHKISEWLASNKLSLNAQKTKFMVFHSMQRKVKYPVLTINNTIIERVKQFNFLGIILHYTLKWQKHIDYISKKSI